MDWSFGRLGDWEISRLGNLQIEKQWKPLTIWIQKTPYINNLFYGVVVSELRKPCFLWVESAFPISGNEPSAKRKCCLLDGRRTVKTLWFHLQIIGFFFATARQLHIKSLSFENEIQLISTQKPILLLQKSLLFAREPLFLSNFSKYKRLASKSFLC